MSEQLNTSSAMEIDPIDDGPKQDKTTTMGSFHSDQPNSEKNQPTPMSISQEDDARRSIEMLRGVDVSERVAAASRLEAVAAALGEERTREVRPLTFTRSKLGAVRMH